MPEASSTQGPVPRIFEMVRDGDVSPDFWQYYGLDPHRLEGDRQERYARIVRTILGTCGLQGRVLSIGCGYGLHEILISFLGERVEEVVGVDILDDHGSDGKIRSMGGIIRRVHADRVCPMLADAGRLPFRGKSFDCALAIDCLSHADYVWASRDLPESQRVLLEEMARVLRVGGLLAVVENNAVSPRNVMRKHGTTCHPVNPFYLRHLMRRLGFAGSRIVPYYDLSDRRDSKARVARVVLDRSNAMGLFVAPLFVLYGRKG